MTEKEMWNQFRKSHPEETDYIAWSFGGGSPQMSDLLASLTLKGIKTATAGLYVFYEEENEPLPVAGDLNIILDTKNEAVCIIETTKVSVVPFDKVTEEHAYKEGEFDRTLSSWRAVHESVFSKELKEIDQVFTKDMLVVCEEYKVVYPEKQEK